MWKNYRSQLDSIVENRGLEKQSNQEKTMSKKLTFQEIILTLQQYWNDQGCMLMQAYDNEKVREP